MSLFPSRFPSQVCSARRQRQIRLCRVQSGRPLGAGQRGELAAVPALHPVPLRAGLLLRLQLDPQLGHARRREQQYQGTNQYLSCPFPATFHILYRVAHLLREVGLVDFDL